MNVIRSKTEGTTLFFKLKHTSDSKNHGEKGSNTELDGRSPITDDDSIFLSSGKSRDHETGSGMAMLENDTFERFPFSPNSNSTGYCIQINSDLWIMKVEKQLNRSDEQWVRECKALANPKTIGRSQISCLPTKPDV